MGYGCQISKHHMLLFNPRAKELALLLVAFQNIICYCLTTTARQHAQQSKDFKTSYVIV